MAFRGISTYGAVAAIALAGIHGCNQKKEGKKDAAAAPTKTGTVITSKTSPNTDSDADDDDDDDGAGGDGSGSSVATNSDVTTDGGDPVDPDSGNDSNPAMDDGPWDAGEGLEACAAKGVAWKAVVDGGPGECSTQKLVSWCCTQENILAHFPALAAQLTTKFNDYNNQGLKLYHCSEEGEQSFFHFAKYDAGSISYKYVYVKGKAATNVPDVTPCPKVTSADLGIPDESDTDGSTGTGTTSTTSSMTNSSTDTANGM